jgi:hypothetical protein
MVNGKGGVYAMVSRRERCRARGFTPPQVLLPKPRWLPLPVLRYAQIVKQYRRSASCGCAIG